MMFCQRCDLTSCLSRHADQTDIWASKSQPTAKTGITQAKIREDGKERQGDRDIRRSLFICLCLSFAYLFHIFLVFSPLSCSVSCLAWLPEHLPSLGGIGMSKGPGPRSSQMIFFSMNSASVAYSWDADCRRREQVNYTKQGFP